MTYYSIKQCRLKGNPQFRILICRALYKYRAHFFDKDLSSFLCTQFPHAKSHGGWKKSIDFSVSASFFRWPRHQRSAQGQTATPPPSRPLHRTRPSCVERPEAPSYLAKKRIRIPKKITRFSRGNLFQRLPLKCPFKALVAPFATLGPS